MYPFEQGDRGSQNLGATTLDTLMVRGEIARNLKEVEPLLVLIGERRSDSPQAQEHFLREIRRQLRIPHPTAQHAFHAPPRTGKHGLHFTRRSDHHQSSQVSSHLAGRARWVR